MSPEGAIAGRSRLARLLSVASRVEHALVCQYLFAAFSMKRSPAEGGVTYQQLERMRQWEGELLLIARQEMEHLGLSFNLRTAIGEAPNFEVAPFPFDESFEGIALRHKLKRFGCKTLLSFAYMEMPDRLPETSPYYKFLKDSDPGFRPARVDAIARLYGDIQRLINDLPEDVLFIGPPGAQLDTPDIFPGAIRGLNLGNAPAYQVQLTKVVDRRSAIAVVDQIILEGEGPGDVGGAGSHFARVMDILMDLSREQKADPRFAPARRVVSNPTLDCAAGATVVTHKFSRDAMQLFELSYETMLLSLSRFFAFPPDDKNEMLALQQIAFFPMMTTIIRPLGEILTELPSGTGDGLRAGPSFRARGTVASPPHRLAAWRMLDLRYQQMAEQAAGLIKRMKELDRALDAAALAAIGARLQYTYEQISRSLINLRATFEGTPDGF